MYPHLEERSVDENAMPLTKMIQRKRDGVNVLESFRNIIIGLPMSTNGCKCTVLLLVTFVLFRYLRRGKSGKKIGSTAGNKMTQSHLRCCSKCENFPAQEIFSFESIIWMAELNFTT